jgi:hypothetical protein
MITISVNTNLRRNVYAQPKFDLGNGVIALEIWEYMTVYDGTNWNAVAGTLKMTGSAIIANSILIDPTTLAIDPSCLPHDPGTEAPTPATTAVAAYDYFMGLTAGSLAMATTDKLYDKIAEKVEQYLTANQLVR